MVTHTHAGTPSSTGDRAAAGADAAVSSCSWGASDAGRRSSNSFPLGTGAGPPVVSGTVYSGADPVCCAGVGSKRTQPVSGK